MFTTEACTLEQFVEREGKYRYWYLMTYPWLKEFPLPMQHLRTFYVEDMNFRNLEPIVEYLNCYEFLFSYFLDNAPRLTDVNRFRGQTFWQRLIKSNWLGKSLIVYSIEKTANQISNPFGIPLWVWLIGGISLIVIVKK